jgi:hypothetical protein
MVCSFFNWVWIYVNQIIHSTIFFMLEFALVELNFCLVASRGDILKVRNVTRLTITSTKLQKSVLLVITMFKVVEIICSTLTE